MVQSKDEGFASFVLANEPQTKEHRIPAAPKDVGRSSVWLPAGENISIAGLHISGGMLYVSSKLRDGFGDVEPSLINTTLKVTATPVDVSLHLTNYWPSYASITPDARRAYLQWLATGRMAPEANIGYVFLYFYGLERRILIDLQTTQTAQADVPTIAAEIRRLLSIYGANNSFRQYATLFLNYIEAEGSSVKAYLNAPPTIVEQSYETPLSLKFGLGQLAMDQRPVPPSWALSWALADPNISRRTPVTRCKAEFAQLFLAKYSKLHGEGFVLRKTKTKLRFSYHPASGCFRGQSFQRNLGDLPDVSATKAPIQKLQAIVDDCSEALDPYSRFVGRNPAQAQALEGLLQLPIEIWPASAKTTVEDLKSRVGDGMLVMTFGELSGWLKSVGPLSRDKVLGLARALESMHLGVEPDVLSGARIPKPENKVVLFATHPEEGDARAVPAYHAAAVTLDLASMVAHADGDASAPELLAITRQIDLWTHLSVNHRKRLKAHLRLGFDQPATLAGLKKKLEPLAADSRRTIARFLAYLTQADGVISPSEVKFLERAYLALGLDTKLVYADIHANEASATTPAVHTATDKSQGFTLDPVRIAELQRETAEVSALLANVFVEDNAPEVMELAPRQQEESPLTTTGILGLDADHSAFLRLLVTRGSWLRTELLDAASDMELMLDGTLEHINESVLDAFDAPLTEGDDPIEINHEVLEALPV